MIILNTFVIRIDLTISEIYGTENDILLLFTDLINRFIIKKKDWIDKVF